MTTLDQRMAALDSGNRIRVRRAEVRREIASLPLVESRRRAAEVLVDPEPACEGMTAWHLLICCRRMGPKKVTSILVRAGVPQHKRLSEMTDRQRDRLRALVASTTADLSV